MLALERLLGEGGVITKETDLYPCGHCQFLIEVQPFKSPSEAGGLCSECMSVICPRCVEVMRKTGICEPIEKALERWERDQATLKRLGLHPHSDPRKGSRIIVGS